MIVGVYQFWVLEKDGEFWKLKGSYSKIRIKRGLQIIWRNWRFVFFFQSGATVAVNEGLVLFQPGWTVLSWHFQLDVELLQCLFQLLLVSSVVRSYGVMEQDELVMQYFHLCGRREKGDNEHTWAGHRLQTTSSWRGRRIHKTLFSSRNFSLTETSFLILSYFSRWIWNSCWDCSILGRVLASRGPRFSSSKSVR